MRRRWWLAAIPAALSLLWLARPAATPGEPARAARTPRPAASAAPAPSPTSAPAAPAVEPRHEVARELPAEGALGRIVQTAMAKPGDSDPRLLDLLSALGAAPSALATVGAAVDPWLAVGLVDLERQVARRCARRLDPDGCWAIALAAEEEVAAALEDPGAAEALRRFRAADAEGAPGGGGVQGDDGGR